MQNLPDIPEHDFIFYWKYRIRSTKFIRYTSVDIFNFWTTLFTKNQTAKNAFLFKGGSD